MDNLDNRQPKQGNSRANLALAGFTAIAAFFLVTEHKAHLLGFYTEHEVHILGALPYLLLLLCPLLHLFMHGGGHDHHGHDDKK
ncbi:MAG TPA: hypothetical protein DEQ20_08695 [Desulfobulbaceae bacterium]|nr:MAG: hypothetical protein A2520_11025 [Deltaproteobacteria bacterium RIFOXYD12_FULL_53_23]HCC54984.1 hypothetical protein [Desulfobulbaceae bacterium]